MSRFSGGCFVALIGLVLVNYSFAQGLIGLAIEGNSPCPKGVLSAERLIGLSPEDENYWNGTFYLESFGTVPEVRIALALDNPARVSVDKKVARVYARPNNTFYITTFKAPPELERVKFVVKGPEGKPFPYVKSLKLNELELCPNPTPWKPTFLNVADVADSVPNRSGPDCGYRQLEKMQLITEGFQTKPGDWPWHVAIFKYDTKKVTQSYICGGTLLSRSYILTAAHCVTESGRVVVPDRLLIGLGKFNHVGSDPGTQDIKAYEVVVHPDFNVTSVANDIALVRLAVLAEYTPYVQPICLWEGEIQDQQIVGSNGLVVGWGRWGFESNEGIAATLQQAYMPVATLTDCLESNRGFFYNFLSDKTFCAGFRNGTSVCNGDSGGGMYFPLAGPVSEQGNQWFIRGIVSLAVPYNIDPALRLCDPSQFVLFTDVAKYVPWIRDILLRRSRRHH